MRIKLLLAGLLILSQAITNAQTNPKPIPSPVVNDYAPILSFLASDWMEGREASSRGGFLAADYIASMMQNIGLKAYKPSNLLYTQLSDYFQPFKVIRYNTEKSSINVSLVKNQEPQLHLNIYNDFKVNNVFRSLSAESTLVFAGYGIVATETGYNDYDGLDVKGKIVLIMEGYPGQQDSMSIAWKKFKTVAENDNFDLDKKCQEASRQGASAIITVSKAFLASKPGNERKKNVAPIKNADYTDAEYVLPSTVNNRLAGCFRLNKNSSERLATLLGIDFRKAERQIAQQLKFQPVILKNSITINSSTVIDTFIVNNVIGFLQGRDTSKIVILGAHYDHLGKRGSTIFNGSDDNASGVAGLLALAKVWTESHAVPPCNILFASWTAEEKGLLGSQYFVQEMKISPKDIKLYINMDMISRSVIEDTVRRQLSIGTRTSDKYIRDLAQKTNTTINPPFILDLWDVTGHSGSDYASFTARNIPIMTFNTGLHNDYHTPRDISATADLVKMGDVLKVVNTSLQEVLENTSGK